MQIKIYNSQKDLSLSATSVRLAAVATLQFLEIQTDELSLHFVSKKKIGEVHLQLFQDPLPTDCISIPMDPPFEYASPHILGEIFVCPKVAIEYSLSHNLDSHREVLLYMIHAILHLAGYDDLTPQDRKKMRLMEKKCLSFLDQKNIVLKSLRTV